MKSLTEAIKQGMDIDWDALDGKTVRIVSSGDLPFETTYTLNYRGKGRKDLLVSWMERNTTNLLFELLYEAWYAPNDYIEIIIDEGVPLLSNTDSEDIDPESIPIGSVILLESLEGGRQLACRTHDWIKFFTEEARWGFVTSHGSISMAEACDPSSHYKVISYITPVELIQTLTTEPSDEEAEGTDTTVHIVSPDSFEAMGKRINGLITHSFGGAIKENLPTEAVSETTKDLKNSVKLSLNLDPDVIGKNLNDAVIEAFSTLVWGKK